MQTLSIIDAIVLTVLAIVLPVLDARDWRQFMAHRAMPGGVPRLAFYRSTMAQAWLVALAVLAAFLLQGRPPAALGLQWPGGTGALWAMLAITALGGTLLIGLRSARRADARQRQQVRDALGPLGDFMPRTRSERRSWTAVSVTAGITEELVFRGYLVWLFSSIVPTVWAVVLSSLLFGLQHVYQGPLGIVRTAAMGAVLCGLYLASGSLLMPIIAHILIDLLQGVSFSAYLREDPSNGERSKVRGSTC